MSTELMSARVALAALAGFAAALRDAGLVVGTGDTIAFARAVASLDPTDVADVYWAGRACLVISSDDIATYDRVFDSYFGAEGGALTVYGEPPSARGVSPGDGLRTAVPTRLTEPGAHSRGLVASAWEALRSKDFSACDHAELAELRRLVAGLRPAAPKRRTRRTRPAVAGKRPDLRRLLRDSIAGEARPARLHWRAPRYKPRPLVLLLDVSGSMTAYSRMLLQFAWALCREDRGREGRGRSGTAEVFCFGTRLTRVTPALASRDPDDALAEAATAVVDWDGGTRIGESVRTFLHEHARRAGCRNAVVVICSDGLERGDPDELAAQMARLRRLSHRVVWVNPLAGGSVFEPTTRGMTAALPHVDALVSGHSLASLEGLAEVLLGLA